MKRIFSLFTAFVLTLIFLSNPLPASANPFSGDNVVTVETTSGFNYTPSDYADDLADLGEKMDGKDQETEKEGKNQSEAQKKFSEFFEKKGKKLPNADEPSENGRSGKTFLEDVSEKTKKAQDMAEKYSANGEDNAEESSGPAKPSDPIDKATDPTSLLDDSDHGGEKEDGDEDPPKPADYDFEIEDFDGPSTSFTGKDGTVTTVYDSGTVITTRPDGTHYGYDYAGRKIDEDSEGTITFTFSDGNSAKYFPDGNGEYTYKEFHYTDGDYKEIHEDGSFTIVDATGYRIDYDKDGNDDGYVYFKDGERARLTDENGEYVKGEFTITGPNGEKLTYKNTIDTENDHEYTDENGNLHYQFGGEMHFTSEGNGKIKTYDAQLNANENDFKVLIDYKGHDGSALKIDGQSGTDEDGNFEGGYSISSVASDGSTLDLNYQNKESNDGKGESSFDVKARDIDGAWTDGHFDMTSDSNDPSKDTVVGTWTSRDPNDGSEVDINVDMKEGNGSFTLHSKDEKGNEVDLGMSGKFDDNGGSVELTSSYKDAETGESGNMRMTADLDANGEVTTANYSQTMTDKDGVTEAMKMFVDQTGGTMEMTDGMKAHFDKDENGEIRSFEATDEDGSFMKWDKDTGTEFSDKKTGDYYKADADGKMESIHTTPDGAGYSYDYHDGTGLYTGPDGSSLVWTHDDNGDLVITSTDGTYSVDEEGNIYRNGEPLRENGKWLNTDTGFKPESSGESSEESGEESEDESSEEESSEEESSEEESSEEESSEEPVAYPTLEELLGSYPKGSLTVTSLVIPEETKERVKAANEASEGGEDGDEGCDFNIDLDSIDAEAFTGYKTAAPFTITQVGENQIHFAFDSDSGSSSANQLNDMTYDPATGTLRMAPFEDEQGYGTFVIQCTYAEDGSVALDGVLTENFKGLYEGISISLAISNTGAPEEEPEDEEPDDEEEPPKQSGAAQQ